MTPQEQKEFINLIANQDLYTDWPGSPVLDYLVGRDVYIK